MARNQKVKWINPETGKVYYYSQIPLPVLKELTSNEEYQKEKQRRNRKYNQQQARKYYLENRDIIRAKQKAYYHTKIKSLLKENQKGE